MEITEAEWLLMRDRVERLDKNVNGNGKPPLEERIRKYIDERDVHKERNAQQLVEDLRAEFEDKHAQNTKILDKICVKVDTIWDAFQGLKGAWIAAGFAGTALIIVVNHYWK